MDKQNKFAALTRGGLVAARRLRESILRNPPHFFAATAAAMRLADKEAKALIEGNAKAIDHPQ
jgi:hypothetical protein